jgi:hypothetical protein
MKFKRYNRTGVSEMIPFKEFTGDLYEVTFSQTDFEQPNIEEGMIARNPLNYNDLWYISKEYFDKNFVEEQSLLSRIVSYISMLKSSKIMYAFGKYILSKERKLSIQADSRFKSKRKQAERFYTVTQEDVDTFYKLHN